MPFVMMVKHQPIDLVALAALYAGLGAAVMAMGMGSGDVESVRLLTRLMAACSWLRVAGAPFACDDDLWALTVGGIASAEA